MLFHIHVIDTGLVRQRLFAAGPAGVASVRFDAVMHP